MLSAMRSSRKILSIVLWIVIIAFVSTIFVVWGVGSNDAQVNYVAKVGSTTVGYDEYRNFYDNTVQSMRDLFGDSYDEYVKTINLDQLILDDLVNRKLMMIEAKRLTIPATDFEIIEAIKAIPTFQTDGFFNPEQYMQILGYYRLTPAAFENSIRESILVEKFKQLVQSSVSVVSDVAAMSEFNYRGTTANVDYFNVDVIAFAPKGDVADDIINAYFEASKDNYIVPTKIKVKYVQFDPKLFKLDNVTVETPEIEAIYAENIAKYTSSDGKISTLDEVRDEISAEIKNNKQIGAFRNAVLASYREILKAGNITAFNEKNPGKLVVFETELFDIRQVSLPVLLALPNFTKGLFDIPKTDLSQIVENGGLSYLFEISDKVEANIPPISEIKEEVIADYKLSQARDAAIANLDKALAENGFLEAAKKYKVKVENTGDFRRAANNVLFTLDTKLIDEIFKAKDGETLSNTYIINNKVYAFKVNSVKLPKGEKFADEKEAIVSYIASIKAETALASYIEALRAATVVDINPTFITTNLVD